jgi:hypothetical protein
MERLAQVMPAVMQGAGSEYEDENRNIVENRIDR